jgi:membrane associated rhomboid family serine protease
MRSLSISHQPRASAHLASTPPASDDYQEMRSLHIQSASSQAVSPRISPRTSARTSARPTRYGTVRAAMNPLNMTWLPDYETVPRVNPVFILLTSLCQVALYLCSVTVLPERDGDSYMRWFGRLTTLDNSNFDKIGGPPSLWLMSVTPWDSCINLHWELWRYVTYALVHANAMHLASNMLMQLAVGLSLEAVHGSARVMLLYILSGFAGAMNCVMFTPEAVIVGASGAIYGLYGVTVANIVINWDVMPARWYRALMSLSLLVQDWVLYFFAHDEFTSYCCHAGGFAFGLIFGVGVLRNLKAQVWEKELALVFFLVGAALVTGWTLWFLDHPVAKAVYDRDGSSNYCCANFLNYGLPQEGAELQDYACMDKGVLFDYSEQNLWAVDEESKAWIVVEQV